MGQGDNIEGLIRGFYDEWSAEEVDRREQQDRLKALFASAKDAQLNPKSLRKAFRARFDALHLSQDEQHKREADDAETEAYIEALARVRTREGEKSTAARKDVQQGRRGPGVGEPTTEQSGLAMPSSREIGRPPMSPAGTQALPVDTPSGTEPAPQVEVPSGEAFAGALPAPIPENVAEPVALPAGDGPSDAMASIPQPEGLQSQANAEAAADTGSQSVSVEPASRLATGRTVAQGEVAASAVASPIPDTRTSIQRTMDEVLIKRGARPEHCLHPDCCGSSTPRALCFTCRMAREEAEAA